MSEYKRLTKKADAKMLDCEYSCGSLHLEVVKRLGELEDKIEQGILVEQKHCNFKVIDHYELGRIFVCLNCYKGFKFPEGDIKSNNYSYCPICGCKIQYNEEDL